ncbi:hypothetical protein BRADI_4g22262v3 [Brachypodium distachyon]|uniref:KIB1-4 beta-propeller domain-containing protein n=1 Tax=Brachypodium distachyon TaxID=15368 RepID=A0A2K2CPI1_BRADI|nr:hypothetical protein BRADI_4g22262v3 [Brachypodium distachyon]
MEGARSRPWSDLQPELLGLVIKGLPSLADCVRLRAVCHPWRSNSILQPPPLPFPWITLPDGTFLSIPAGEIHCLPVPADACCQSSIDNWLFLVHSDGVCSLMNIFSKATLELPELAKVWKREIGRQFLNRFPEPVSYRLAVPPALDSSPNPLVVTVIIDSFNCGTLCISHPPTVTYSFRGGKESLPHLSGVAFLDGKLYTLSDCWKLLALEFCKGFGSYPNIKCVIDTDGFCQEQEPPRCLLGGRSIHFVNI